MSDIPSANQKIQIEATQYRGPVSESLLQTVGGSVNYALDQVASNASSIASVSGSLSTLTTELNSSSECFKQTASYDNQDTSFGSNSSFADGQLIERNTLSLSAASGEWWWLYFACDLIDTTRQPSIIKITFANEPDFGTTLLFDANREGYTVGFAKPFFLPPGTGTFTVYVDLYAATSIPGTGTRNRWKYRIQGKRFDPTRFIIP